jgi:hypothetical protein
VLVLRADPWMPDHGMGFEAAVLEDQDPVRADPFVEREDWSEPITPAPGAEGPVWFVDGVRRVEVRLLADQDGHRAPGLFGSHAVGSVCCDGRAVFGEHRVGRALVLGGGLKPEAVQIAVGKATIDFVPESVTGSEPREPLEGLQDLMRKAEASLAAHLAAETGRIVLVDGPITLWDPTKCPGVGVVKRFHQQHLDPEHEVLVTRLRPGERTPLFGLSRPEEPGDRHARYAWYARLVPWRMPWHDHAGVVRCEVRAGLGLHQAVDMANRVSALLPAYAGRPTDPRAPQNLAPVGGLETWLRHRMGHAGIIRRALLERLGQEAA